MNMDPQQIVAFIGAISFAAGLNVYATIATLGLLGHFGVLPLPARLSTLEHWPVIIIALALFTVEFFADKVPYFDLLWNALHTFVRVPIAAFIAWQASAQLTPSAQLAASVLGGAVALIAHGGKTAARVGVTPSPEPVTNFALSTAEDVGAVGITWFAAHHPYVAAATVAVLLVVTVLLARLIIRSLRSGWRELRKRWAPA